MYIYCITNKLNGKQYVGKSVFTAKNQRKRSNQPNANPVVQFYKNGEVVAWYISAAEAMRQTRVFLGSILNCCKSTAKTAGKFKWKYLEGRLWV